MLIKNLLICSLLMTAACNGRKAPTPHPHQTRGHAADTSGIPGNFSAQSALKFDSSLLLAFFRQHPTAANYRNDEQAFYRQRKFAFAWYDSKGLTEQAGNLYNRIKNGAVDGVNGQIPYMKQLDSLMETPDASESSHRLNTELLLTLSYFYFAEIAWSGLDDSAMKKAEWYLPRKKTDYAAWLSSYLQSPAGSPESNEPVYRQYALLRSYLTKYAALSAKRPWTTIKEDRRSYQIEDTGRVIVDIRKRLYEWGDLQIDKAVPVFDIDLEQAVKRCQHRFGMKEDGIIGKAMLSELNRPLKERVMQIMVNMERARWLPDSVGGQYLAVNIPEFKLHMYSGDSLLWDMNVVVGKAVHKTVVFSGPLKYIVFSPYWNVPPGILKSEILPGIRKDKGYLALHHMEWSGGSVRQRPGPWNSLGRVKFLFPNRFNIYLHDTPAQHLFGEEKRALSHGCIRLAEPAKLAMFLLRNEPKWTEAEITRAMGSGKEQYVTLKASLPVFITYFTAWVDRAGQLNFRPDIYGRDKRLDQIMVKN